jgi:hypothetical protein
MSYQNISATLPDATIVSIKNLATQARVLLPFLQTLTAGDRIGLYKMGPKRLAWVMECLQAAKNHPEILPPHFKLAEFEQKYELARALADLRAVFKSLFTDVDDTTMGVGSEAATKASAVMGYVDAAAKTEPGLKSVAESLHAFFARADEAAKADVAAVK